MKLYIAEKPSLGRAIANELPKPHKRFEGYIEVGGGDKVTWCIGHVLEQAEPEDYDPAFKKWRLDHLPIIPEQFQLKVKRATAKQYKVLKGLMLKAETLIHAGDPDREGQLLVDEVIHYVFNKKTMKPPVKRLLINDMNSNAIKASLQSLRDNREFSALSASALARSRADWVYGINMTRLSTLKGRQQGAKGVLSVGRVQTPLLGLVVNRDEAIEQFNPKPYFDVEARVETQQGDALKASWVPSDACIDYQDEEGRVLSKKLAEHVCQRIAGKPATVADFTQKTQRRAPPLPYNLSSLQIDAARIFSMSAKQVLDTCQFLYEKQQLISYPRSDCRYLPEGHHQQAAIVSASIANNVSALKLAASDAALNKRSKAFNDKKVDAHHAIIPTQKAQPNGLSGDAQKLYQLIARQYLMQFYPPQVLEEQKLSLTIEGGLFKASGLYTTEPGWHKLLVEPAYGGKAPSRSESRLPVLNKGDNLQCLEGVLLEKETQPPARFTEATLLSAMTNVARFVKDKAIKKVLRETDGLGTEATRAAIIELLFKRQFLVRKGKQIHSTPLGRQLIKSLPALSTEPDLTARWESELASIAQKEQTYPDFFKPLTTSVTQLIADLR